MMMMHQFNLFFNQLSNILRKNIFFPKQLLDMSCQTKKFTVLKFKIYLKINHFDRRNYLLLKFFFPYQTTYGTIHKQVLPNFACTNSPVFRAKTNLLRYKYFLNLRGSFNFEK
ncbi:hypothetical protein BpHYR1_003925 [Brachionus plicatilis]|uniref:Uncharacterized protein n=1 Tax=Brachionus plicatilis TaxID=10195 RepID=A0A3M7QAH7_BRAPC|nr:hypothetical protein BpHYR1_003925 [Brachionus plicatilis]